MNAARGIGPVAYKIDQLPYLIIFNLGAVTVIASESCLARGVDHCLASADDHLIFLQ
jgi:hypothetical protein